MKFSSSLRSKILCISGLDVTVPPPFFSCIYLDYSVCTLGGDGVLVVFCYDETLNKEFIWAYGFRGLVSDVRGKSCGRSS